jgi:AraC family ethanolamine operon transcriptional activator
MNNVPIAPTLVPKIFRFTDIDAFRSSVRNLSVDFTPLVRTISAEQVILNLPGCDVNYTKSFPRIIDAQLGPNCTAVGFTMDDGYPIRFNGVEEMGRPNIVIGRGGAFYSQVERTQRQYASIVFAPEIEDRGWPRSGTNFMIFETSAASHRALRELTSHVTSASMELVDTLDVAGVSAAIRESFLAAIDSAFADAVNTEWTSRADCARHFKVFRDVQAALSDNIAQPVYSGELAKQIGVSVRTMHDAVKRYRGMTLHRYLRVRRLWLVRKRLIEGSQSVKASALAFGFWHLGDFSMSYRSQFGETPSETLARSRCPSR